MRTAITIGVGHDGKTTELLHGAEVPINEQVSEIKKLAANPAHEKFSRVELWESGFGIAKRIKFEAKAAEARRGRGRAE